jgi:nucleoside-diphosphate-sugar epimerase
MIQRYKSMSRRALITGIDGFTGTYVQEVLERAGFEVFGISLGDATSPTFFKADLTNEQALTEIVANVKAEVVIHLAAQANVAHRNLSEMYLSNVLGTRNLLSALNSTRSAEQIILASSATVYGVTDNPTEASPVAPTNDYGFTKAASELMAQTIFKTLPVTIVRPFNYTGAGQSENFVIPKIVNHFARKENEISLGAINVEREFNDVRWVSKIYTELAAQKTVPGTIVNICSGKPVSLSKVIQILEDVSGHRLSIQVDQSLIRKGEIKRLSGNNSGLVDLLPDCSSAPPLEETLDWMYHESSKKLAKINESNFLR